nr:replication-relaxation family protein [Micromonospora sp. DSM 115978]
MLRELTPRDLYLLDVLKAHRVLTAEQAADLVFPSLDRAQRRLLQLTRRGVLARFRACVRPGSQPWRYTLGWTGAALVAAARADRPPARAAHDLTVTRLARNPQLDHMLGTNSVFTALAAHAATATATGTRLATWYSDDTATSLLGTLPYVQRLAPRPDGFGRWTAHGRTVAFRLEYDTGTEPLTRLLDKLTAYDAVPHETVLLFHLPNPPRETNFRRTAAGRFRHVATTAADLVAAGGLAAEVG